MMQLEVLKDCKLMQLEVAISRCQKHADIPHPFCAMRRHRHDRAIRSVRRQDEKETDWWILIIN